MPSPPGRGRPRPAPRDGRHPRRRPLALAGLGPGAGPADAGAALPGGLRGRPAHERGAPRLLRAGDRDLRPRGGPLMGAGFHPAVVAVLATTALVTGQLVGRALGLRRLRRLDSCAFALIYAPVTRDAHETPPASLLLGQAQPRRSTGRGRVSARSGPRRPARLT